MNRLQLDRIAHQPAVGSHADTGGAPAAERQADTRIDRELPSLADLVLADTSNSRKREAHRFYAGEKYKDDLSAAQGLTKLNASVLQRIAMRLLRLYLESNTKGVNE